MIHKCVGRANLEIWNLETYVLQKAGNQEIQTLETSRLRSSGGGEHIYIYSFCVCVCGCVCFVRLLSAHVQMH